MTEMILASLSKIWHLVPIVIAIILLKKFMDNKSNNYRIRLNEENEKKGLTLLSRTIKKYEDLDYLVVNISSDDEKKELGIDLHCSKENKTTLVKCINSTKVKSISSEDVQIFYTNALEYIKINDIEKKNTSFRYGVIYRDVLDKSAIKSLTNDSSDCKYMIL